MSNDLTQMVNFPSGISDNFPYQISGSDSHSPALVDLFLFSDASICSTVAFPPLRNSDHVVVSVSIDVPSYSQQDALFHHIAYDYSCADWCGLHHHLRDVPWDNFYKFSASAAASEFSELVQVGIDVYIPHQNFQVKPYSSPWFLTACDWGSQSADWDGLCDHLRDVPWDDFFKLSASAAASEFCEWVQVGIDVYIPYQKY